MQVGAGEDKLKTRSSWAEATADSIKEKGLNAILRIDRSAFIWWVLRYIKYRHEYPMFFVTYLNILLASKFLKEFILL